MRPIIVGEAIFPFPVTSRSCGKKKILFLYPPVLMLPRDHSRNVQWESLCAICSLSPAEVKHLSSSLLLAAMGSAMHGSTSQTQFISSTSSPDGLMWPKTPSKYFWGYGKGAEPSSKPLWLDRGLQTCQPPASQRFHVKLPLEKIMASPLRPKNVPGSAQKDPDQGDLVVEGRSSPQAPE